MPQLTENAFTFESKALPKETFSVVRFSGEEGLSTLYRFEILLISEEQDLDIAAVLQHPATFTIKNRFANGPELPFHGILSAFEQLHQFGTYTFYRTELRPKLWWLTQTHHNQVFLDQKIDQFAATVLQDGGLSQGMDFEFCLQGQYAPREYVCQYGESHFDFVSRWMEREGIYYWFEQGEQSEKMIASDTHIAHTPLSGHEKFIYSPPSGLDDTCQDKVIQRFSLKQTPMPKNVLLKDYNYMKPSLDLEGKAQVREQGRGEVYLYGEHFPNRSEGQRLATVRAEAYLCREKVFNSQSTVPAVRPGYLFNLERHYSNGFNRDYLTTSVHHEGSQEQYLVSGLGVKGVEDHQGLFYRNTFTCISGDTQYRPERVTPKPRIAGSLSAKIDAAGSGKYAELDEHGRYKVILPFDLSGRKDGKGSTWIRMMQPYAGQGMGFHAPLHKGTEVLLSFIEADPDRPVISGAIPNPETPSPVHDANQTQVRLKSASGNVMHMEDQEGHQRILLHSPSANTFLRLGAPNDPDSKKDKEQDKKLKKHDKELEDHDEELEDHDERLEELETEWGARLFTDKALKIQVGGENAVIGGECIETIVGADIGIKLVTADEFIGGLKTELMLGGTGSYHYPAHWLLKGSEEKVAEQTLEVIEAKQAAVGEYDVVHGERGEVTATVTTVTGEVSRAVADSNEVRGVVTDATGEVNRALGERITAVGNQTQAIGTCLRAIGTKLDTAGTKLESAGHSIHNSGVSVRSAGSRIQSAGSHLSNASMIIRDAPIIMDQ